MLFFYWGVPQGKRVRKQVKIRFLRRLVVRGSFCLGELEGDVLETDFGTFTMEMSDFVLDDVFHLHRFALSEVNLARHAIASDTEFRRVLADTRRCSYSEALSAFDFGYEPVLLREPGFYPCDQVAPRSFGGRVVFIT
jgi:hypothetical protein